MGKNMLMIAFTMTILMSSLMAKVKDAQVVLYKDVLKSVKEWSVRGKATLDFKKYKDIQENGLAVHYNIADEKSKHVTFSKKITPTKLPKKFDILLNLESLNGSANLEINLKDSGGVSYKGRIYLGAREKKQTAMVIHSDQLQHVGSRKEKNIRPTDVVEISFVLSPIDTRITPEFKKVSGIVIISGLKIISRMETPKAFRFGNIYSDNMVFQKGSPITVFGYAKQGTKVNVKFNGQTKEGISKDGIWQVTFKAMEYGGPYVVTATMPGKKITIKNVMIGEVWLGSGQSNMEAQFGWIFPPDAINEVKSCYDEGIRFFSIPITESKTPLRDIMDSDEKWEVCAPETLPGFSATGYYFAKYIHKYLGEKITVGIIVSAKGGSPIEPWLTSLKVAKAVPELKNMTPHSAGRVATRYNAMINPLKVFDLRGAIWYQGESNAKHMSYEYRYWLQTLIKGWRSEWKDNLPFLIVQLPNFEAKKFETDSWAVMRESQALTLTLPNTAMVVTTDIGTVDNIHPDNKPALGKRLVLLARNFVYGDKKVIAYSPLFKSMKVKDKNVEITFTHTESPLKVKGKTLTGLTIAGSDKVFKKAEAKLQGNTVIVWNKAVP